MSKSNVIRFEDMVARLNKGQSLPDVELLDEMPVREAPPEGSVWAWERRSVVMAVSWALETGRVALAEELWTQMRACGFESLVPLPDNLGAAVEEMDTTIAMFGKESGA